MRAKTGLAFDLPTEAQWEWACRAGTATALYNGKDLTSSGACPNLAELGRYLYNGGQGGTRSSDLSAGTVVVGSYLPNAWGLYDMLGNTWEWCLDWYAADLGMAAVTDPVGPASGRARLYRGGAWRDCAQYCRSAYRYSHGHVATDADYTLGVRLALTDGQQ